jgi:hypothetical protein
MGTLRKMLGWARDHGAWIVATCAFLLAVYDSRANREQLDLVREQVLASVRPMLVPVKGARYPMILKDDPESAELVVRFAVRNVAEAATLGGEFSIASTSPDSFGEREAFFVFPSCDAASKNAFEDTQTLGIVPPIAAGETATFDVRFVVDPREYGGGEHCAAAVYSDAAGGQWVSDWVWEDFKPGSPVMGRITSHRVRETERNPAVPGLYYEPVESPSNQ